MASWDRSTRLRFMQLCCKDKISEETLSTCLDAAGLDIASAWSYIQFVGEDETDLTLSSDLKSMPPSNLRVLVHETLCGSGLAPGKQARRYNMLELSDVDVAYSLLQELAPAALCANTNCSHCTGGSKCTSSIDALAKAYEVCSALDVANDFSMIAKQTIIGGPFQNFLLSETDRKAHVGKFTSDLSFTTPMYAWNCNTANSKTIEQAQRAIMSMRGLKIPKDDDLETDLHLADLRTEFEDVSLYQIIRGVQPTETQKRLIK